MVNKFNSNSQEVVTFDQFNEVDTNMFTREDFLRVTTQLHNAFGYQINKKQADVGPQAVENQNVLSAIRFFETYEKALQFDPTLAEALTPMAESIALRLQEAVIEGKRVRKAMTYKSIVARSTSTLDSMGNAMKKVKINDKQKAHVKGSAQVFAFVGAVKDNNLASLINLLWDCFRVADITLQEVIDSAKKDMEVFRIFKGLSRLLSSASINNTQAVYTVHEPQKHIANLKEGTFHYDAENAPNVIVKGYYGLVSFDGDKMIIRDKNMEKKQHAVQTFGPKQIQNMYSRIQKVEFITSEDLAARKAINKYQDMASNIRSVASYIYAMRDSKRAQTSFLMQDVKNDDERYEVTQRVSAINGDYSEEISAYITKSAQFLNGDKLESVHPVDINRALRLLTDQFKSGRMSTSIAVGHPTVIPYVKHLHDKNEQDLSILSGYAQMKGINGEFNFSEFTYDKAEFNPEVMGAYDIKAGDTFYFDEKGHELFLNKFNVPAERTLVAVPVTTKIGEFEIPTFDYYLETPIMPIVDALLEEQRQNGLTLASVALHYSFIKGSYRFKETASGKIIQDPTDAVQAIDVFNASVASDDSRVFFTTGLTKSNAFEGVPAALCSFNKSYYDGEPLEVVAHFPLSDRNANISSYLDEQDGLENTVSHAVNSSFKIVKPMNVAYYANRDYVQSIALMQVVDGLDKEFGYELMEACKNAESVQAMEKEIKSFSMDGIKTEDQYFARYDGHSYATKPENEAEETSTESVGDEELNIVPETEEERAKAMFEELIRFDQTKADDFEVVEEKPQQEEEENVVIAPTEEEGESAGFDFSGLDLDYLDDLNDMFGDDEE